MNLLPVIRPRYFDSNGDPLVGGKLYTYISGTTTPQATYTDAGGGTPNANPIILDANGECSLWADPNLSYKFVLTNSSDVTQWTVDGVVGLLAPDSVVAASIADGAVEAEKLSADAIHGQTQDTAPVGADEVLTYDASASALKRVLISDIIKLITPTGIWAPYSGTSAPTGWVMLSGRTIGSAASSATERANADTSDLYSLLWGAYTNTELVIQDSSGTPTTRGASASADFSANKRLPLPDMRGRVVAGKDDMGGSAASRLGATYFGADATILGKSGGSESHLLTSAQSGVPAHTHTTTLYGGGGGSNLYRGNDAGGSAGGVASGANSPADASSAHNNVQPTTIANYIIKL